MKANTKTDTVGAVAAENTRPNFYTLIVRLSKDKAALIEYVAKLTAKALPKLAGAA